MRKLVLAGAAAFLAAIGVAGVANAAGDMVPVYHAQVTKAAWRGGFWGPRFGGRMYFGPSFGFGLYAPLWAPPPVYYAPPPVVVQQGYGAPPAPAYAPPATAAPNPGDWYYCGNPQGYYPYVRSCNGQWQTVPANPSAPAE